MNKKQILSDVTSYRRNKNRDDEIKNIAGHVLTYNSKNFHWLNRKPDLERTMNGYEKPFRKKSDRKNWKNSKDQSEIATCEQKPTSESEFLFEHRFLTLL